MKQFVTLLFLFVSLMVCRDVYAAKEAIDPDVANTAAIFDDKMLLNGYAEKYNGKSKEILLAMMNDSTLGPFKIAAAVKVFKEQFASQTVAAEKNFFEKILVRLLSHDDSPFVQVEVMHTLVILDRYRYFKVMVPRLIEKMDHYNDAVCELAYDNLTALIHTSTSRTREARIIFTTLRKILFLSRNKLQYVQEPDEKLQKKLDLLFWTIKVLGTQELKQLPSEVIRLL